MRVPTAVRCCEGPPSVRCCEGSYCCDGWCAGGGGGEGFLSHLCA